MAQLSTIIDNYHYKRHEFCHACDLTYSTLARSQVTSVERKVWGGLAGNKANGSFEHLLVYEPHFHGNTTKYGSDCLATLFANSCLLILVC